MPKLRASTCFWTSLTLTAALVTSACHRQAAAGAGTNLQSLMATEHLTDADVTAALKTYIPPGKHDPYLMFASGGHSGDLMVVGVPSMRIIRYVGVFTPEPWQGYGFDDATCKMLKDSSPKGETLTWGDMHHPALSETNGDYDGQFVFVNDKANARIAVVNLKDFATTQIVRSGLIRTDHGGTFVTPNTDYVIETGQYPATLDGSFQPLSQYNDKYRGAVIFWKFDRQQGRIDEAKSFAIELPPYMQDLADAGKLGSDGWAFVNSFNTERATGGDADGQPPLEAGASQNDMDYLHLINWKKAAELVQQGKATTIRGMKVLPLETAIASGVLYFVPEPRSPHGVDVTPDGKEICISGKLDTHVTVYSFAKLMNLIQNGKFDGKDPYGVPILPFKDSIRGQVQVGLGPLHTQFDGKGNAYTSLFIESAVAKWNLKTLQVESKIPVHYNIGHLIVAGGDTEHPDGRYLVADNKWTIERFDSMGPKEDPNFELIDISQPKMQLLYDAPIPLGEPHYGQIISAAKIKALPIYPMGYNVSTGTTDPTATIDETKAHIVRQGNHVDVYMTAVRSHFTPDTVQVRQGDIVSIHLTNVEQTRNAIHGFAISDYNIDLSLEPGRTQTVTFQANRPGIFPYYCTDFCSALHLEMMGYLEVKPSAGGSAAGAAH